MNSDPEGIGVLEDDVLVRQEALVLRVAPWSNTSRIVTWLTPRRGKIATLIRGALRPKNHFLGQFDAFYTCDLVYYRHATGDLHTARECAPLLPRRRLRSDWRAAALASYACDLTDRALPPEAAHSDIFALLTALLDTLEAGAPRKGALLLWFELGILLRLGYAPQCERCAACGDLPADGRVFSAARGGILCAGCARSARDAIPMTVNAAARLARWQTCADPSQTQADACPRRAWRECEMALGAFLRYHLNLPLPSRDAALDVLWQPDAAPEQTMTDA